MKSLLVSISCIILVALVASGCGEDSPTAPAGGGGNNIVATNGVTVSDETVDYGVVCFGSDRTRTVTIKARDDNTGEATGYVELSPATVDSYNIQSGGGDYTLAPGEERRVVVRYNPQKLYRTHSGDLVVHVQDGVQTAPVEVGLNGFSSAKPYLVFAPAGGVVPAYDTNYRPLSASGAVTVAVDGNVDYETPRWLQCNGPTWIFNGNSITESRVWFEFNVPAGTTKMTVTMRMEAEGDCTQLLIEIDGKEFRWDDLGGRCQTISKILNISPGKRDIRIGTDQSSFCSDDLAIWDLKIEFNRACLSPDEVF